MTVGVAAPPLVRDSPHQHLLLAIGGASLLALVVGLSLRWSAALACSVAALGAQQAVRLALGPDAVDPWAPLYAGGMLLGAELAWWSIEPRVPVSAEPGLATRRLASVLVVCACGSVLAALVVLAAGAPLSGGVALELVGVLAAAGALAVVVTVARSGVG